MTDQTEIELQAAAFRRLQQHLMEERTDVQNIDLMNLAGFCRNCLSRWYQEAANARGIEMGKEEAREKFYGMTMEEWKAKYQTDASATQKADFRDRLRGKRPQGLRRWQGALPPAAARRPPEFRGKAKGRGAPRWPPCASRRCRFPAAAAPGALACRRRASGRRSPPPA